MKDNQQYYVDLDDSFDYKDKISQLRGQSDSKVNTFLIDFDIEEKPTVSILERIVEDYDLEIENLRYEMQNIQQQLNEEQFQSSTTHTTLIKYEEAIDEYQEKIQQLKQNILQLENQRDEICVKYSELWNLYNDKECESEVVNELKRTNDTLSHEIQSINEKIDSLFELIKINQNNISSSLKESIVTLSPTKELKLSVVSDSSTLPETNRQHSNFEKENDQTHTESKRYHYEYSHTLFKPVEVNKIEAISDLFYVNLIFKCVTQTDTSIGSQIDWDRYVYTFDSEPQKVELTETLQQVGVLGNIFHVNRVKNKLQTSSSYAVDLCIQVKAQLITDQILFLAANGVKSIRVSGAPYAQYVAQVFIKKYLSDSINLVSGNNSNFDCVQKNEIDAYLSQFHYDNCEKLVAINSSLERTACCNN